MLSKTRFQALLAYTRKKERAAQGRFFVEGWRWLEEALTLPAPPACVLVVPSAARSTAEGALLERARAVAPEFHEVTGEQLARLTESSSSPGVAALVSWAPAESLGPGLLASPPPALVLALDGLGDPGNAGTLIRTAEWFGAAGVVFGEGSVEPTNPKALRATMGSLFRLPIVQPSGLAAALGQVRAAGFASVGAVLGGTPLPEFAWPERTMLVIGNEANGIRRELAELLDHRVTIPAYGRAESLNAAVAGAVLLADWRTRLTPRR